MELMIVVAIIGLLASVAVPQFNNYVDKAKVSEALVVSGYVRKLYEIWWAENGTCPRNIESVAFSATMLNSFPYVTEVHEHPNNSGHARICSFRVRLDHAQNTQIDNKWIIWYNNAKIDPPQGNQNLAWVCVSDWDATGNRTDLVVSKYLPVACKRKPYAGGAHGLPFSQDWWYQ